MNLRMGIGYDVHRLKQGEGFPLGGVWIPCEYAVEAHSDGDVLCHAVADAFLGAAAMGDIGDHFPDTDERWRGAKGASLIAAVLDKIHKQGFQPVQLDTIIQLQHPRLGPYKPQIRRSLASMLRLSENQINIKAGTAEGLGSVGRREAVAAWACMVIEFVG